MGSIPASVCYYVCDSWTSYLTFKSKFSFLSYGDMDPYYIDLLWKLTEVIELVLGNSRYIENQPNKNPWTATPNSTIKESQQNVM